MFQFDVREVPRFMPWAVSKTFFGWWLLVAGTRNTRWLRLPTPLFSNLMERHIPRLAA